MELIGAGRASRIFALDDEKVLRRCEFDVRDEARVMRWVRERGFPAPEVFEVSGGDLVMERLHGPTLGSELFGARIDAAKAGEILIDLHERLHAIEVPDWLAGEPRGIDLRAADGPTCVLHLDLHPENVILTDDGPFLVDWTNAARGEPGIDLAVSWAILAGVDLDGLGMAPQWVEVARAALLGRLREPLSTEALCVALRFREADRNVDPAEIAKLRMELGQVR
ncbi:BUD32 family EKC/KEOPS complex subunit [Glycomyces tarimensis]